MELLKWLYADLAWSARRIRPTGNGSNAMIRYFIPSDGDDADHPNVFHLPSDVVGSGSVRFGDVKRNFPLPGQYHFRFKRNFGDAFGGSLRSDGKGEMFGASAVEKVLSILRDLDALKVWVDMTEEGAMVPSCEGVFTAKITRLSGPGAGGMAPPMYGSTKQGGVVGGGNGGGGMGSDDLLNMGQGSPPPPSPGSIPGPGSLGGGSQPDLLNMGMFDSSPATGVASPTASARPAGVRGASQMPGSPLMHQPPMSQMQGVVGGTGGRFGVGGIGAPRPSHGSMGQWQHQPQQQQFARFPAQGRGNM